MKHRVFLPLLVFVSFASGTVSAAEKWIYLATNLQVDDNVGKVEKLLERGSASGYTHVLLADSKLARLGTLGDIYPRYARNTETIKAAAERLKIEIVPAVFDVGYSNAMLFNDPNLVEGQPARDVPLVVKDGIARIAEQTVNLPGGGFSDLKKWSWKDDEIVVEDGAARVNANGKNARIVAKLRVEPWREYHVSVRVKTRDLRGALPEVKALPGKGGGQLNWANLGVARTQDWKTHHVIFNSREQTEVNLFFGMWGTESGTVWWDNPSIEEVAFVNLIRRGGCPLIVVTEDGKKLTEGRDFEPLRDEKLGTTPWPGEFDVYHAPPLLKTGLPNGTRLRVSFFHAVTVYDGQVMFCPSERKTMELLRDEARRVHELWHAKAYMMSHDECRVMNWCDACQGRNLTPGQMLSENVKECVQILNEVNPGGRIYVWSDMFDPHHNAVKGPYYLVNGPLIDSWAGLDPSVAIMNWNFDHRDESLKFFAERGHKQVLAGYYDANPNQIKAWLTSAKAVPKSVEGVMYTTWRSNYSDLEAFSKVANENTPK